MSNSWLEPPQWPALGDTEAHVWLAHLPSARGELARLTDVLSANERGRASRFRSEEYRERTQLTRGLLRLLLARYLRETEEQRTAMSAVPFPIQEKSGHG